jgi:hypothetical protein
VLGASADVESARDCAPFWLHVPVLLEQSADAWERLALVEAAGIERTSERPLRPPRVAPRVAPQRSADLIAHEIFEHLLSILRSSNAIPIHVGHVRALVSKGRVNMAAFVLRTSSKRSS